jgi:hypothetical protein
VITGLGSFVVDPAADGKRSDALFAEKNMRGITIVVLIVLVLALAGMGFVAVSDMKPPVQRVEQSVPDANLPR